MPACGPMGVPFGVHDGVVAKWKEAEAEVIRLRGVIQGVIDGRADYGLEIDDPLILTLQEGLVNPLDVAKHSWEGCRACGWLGEMDAAYAHLGGCPNCQATSARRVFSGTRIEYRAMLDDPGWYTKGG